MKKNVLIIVLPYFRKMENIRPETLVKSVLGLPQGALSIATYCKDVANIRIVDCNADANYPASMLWEMQGFRPDIIGISMSYDMSYTYLETILGEIRNIDPDVPVVIGGSATVLTYKEILEDNVGIFAVCYFDGEVPMKELIEAENPYTYMNNSPSWVTRRSLKNGIQPVKSIIEDLNDIIDLEYSFVDVNKYEVLPDFTPYIEDVEAKRRFNLITSRGCPYNCGFCYKSGESDKRMRYADVDKVIWTVNRLVNEYGVGILTIQDDQLLFNTKRAKEMFRRLEQFHIRVEVSQGVSVAFIDDEMAELMKRAGMVKVVLPIESGSKYMLDRIINKPVNLDKAKKVIKILREKGFWIQAAFVIGYPGEEDCHRQETMKWIREAEIDWCNFSPACPTRGSKLYDLCVENKYINPNMKMGELDYTNYIIDVPGYPVEYVNREIYKMNLRCNFVENYSMRQGRYDVAAKMFKQVIDRYESHAFAWYYLSECLGKLDDWDGAIRSQRRYLELLDSAPTWKQYAEELL